MAQCAYRYPTDNARCLYDDHRLGEGEWCMEHREVHRREQEIAKMNAKNKAKRAEARRSRLTDEERALWAARMKELGGRGLRTGETGGSAATG